MDDPSLLDDVLRWLVPAVVVVVIAAVLVVAAGWGIRLARRSPRARAAAEAARTRAGSALVTLDDAVAELDLEVGLSGALYGGTSPAPLRRARMTAQHVRDEAFAEYAAISDDARLLPSEVVRRSDAIRARVTQALAVIGHAHTEHERWMHENTSAAAQVEGARARLAALHEQMGDPAALLADLAARYDESEWRDAADAAAAARTHAEEAEPLLARAAASADDPSRSALSDLALVERRIRAAHDETARMEEVQRLVSQAVAALPDEVEAARAAIRQANATREQADPDAAVRLGEAIREAQASLDALEQQAARRPTAAIAGIARLRARLDVALGDARTAGARLRGARTALPGAMAAARQAVTLAERAASRAGADARVRLARAHAELATARQLQDPVEALDAARRALRNAEDAQALAGYDRMASGR